MTKHRKLKTHLNKYKGMTVIKIKTDIIAASLIEQAVIMYVETFKTDVIVLIDNFIICLTSHWPMFFSSRVNPLILVISLTPKLEASRLWLFDGKHVGCGYLMENMDVGCQFYLSTNEYNIFANCLIFKFFVGGGTTPFQLGPFTRLSWRGLPKFWNF